MTARTKRRGRRLPTESERAWLRTFMHLIRVSPRSAREPDLIDRQVSEKYNLGLALDRPRDPTETQRMAAGMFCQRMTPQRFTHFMRDDDLRREMRALLAEAPLVREIFQEKNAALVGLIDTDPPTLRLASSAGPELA